MAKKAKSFTDDDTTMAALSRVAPIDDDVQGHRLAGNDNETIVEDDGEDVEGHTQRRYLDGREGIDASSLARRPLAPGTEDDDDVEGHGRRR